MKRIILTGAIVAFMFGGFAIPATANTMTSNIAIEVSDSVDDALDKYEEFVDEYIELYKKAQAGDMTALAQYASVLQKAQEFQNKLANADNMTPAQTARYAKITAKLANAIR